MPKKKKNPRKRDRELKDKFKVGNFSNDSLDSYPKG